MAFSTLIALLQDAPAADGTASTIRIVAGILAIVLVVIIIMRRKKTAKKSDEEEF